MKVDINIVIRNLKVSMSNYTSLIIPDEQVEVNL